MALLIGTDEAGYGPNLGPLVIAATTWRVPDDLPPDDLLGALSHVLTGDCDATDYTRVPIADSKVLYQPARGIGLLEAGVLAAWRAAGIAPRTWRETWPAIAGEACDPTLLWHSDFDAPLPHAAEPSLVAAWADCLSTGLRTSDVRLTAVRARVVQPAEFNRRVAELDSKGALLSEATLRLAADLVHAQLDDCRGNEPILLLCDKHGGRDRYAGVLQHIFPEAALTVVKESRPVSCYRLKLNKRKLEIRFQAKGESFLPAALASMTAKYLRELAMAAFNAFWLARVPGLKPTAGYPSDARRFRTDIAASLLPLGIAEEMIWRSR